MRVQVTGLNSVQKALDDAMKGVKIESEEMLTVMLMAISANTAPFIPVDTSGLINSEERSVYRDGKNEIVGEISYGADGSVNSRGTPVQEYAGFVHDGVQKNWQKPGASNLFLEKGTRDFIQDDLSGIISAYSS
tara:strand:+ start:415 stop:816 length:402 start_codon:yes stop_codon:yes gene_type:complete